MFKFSFKFDSAKYQESEQKNPIRWRFLYRISADLFEDQSGWMKCKDFFNDVVAAITGKKFFSIYSFTNENLKINDEGFYVLVKNITTKERFLHNLEVINKQLLQDLQCEVKYVDWGEDEQLLLLFPPKVMMSTYYISMLTLVLRWANYDKKVKDWEDLWKLGQEKEGAMPSFSVKAVEKALKDGFKNKLAEVHWWFYNEKYHSGVESDYLNKSIIHNNGIVAWTQFV